MLKLSASMRFFLIIVHSLFQIFRYFQSKFNRNFSYPVGIWLFQPIFVRWLTGNLFNTGFNFWRTLKHFFFMMESNCFKEQKSLIIFLNLRNKLFEPICFEILFC